MSKILLCFTLLCLFYLTNGQRANCKICKLDGKCLVPDKNGNLLAKSNANFVWSFTVFDRIQSMKENKIYNLCGLNNNKIGLFTAEKYEGADCEWKLSGMENQLFAIKNVQYKTYINVVEGQEAAELKGTVDQWKVQC
uniref:Secreted salivary protein n=1 Tax=Culicoides sonorensis TaxID=179676 RepID=Q66TZ8_CULSO|nr:unknown salivary protein [Culicoides sonorensis]